MGKNDRKVIRMKKVSKVKPIKPTKPVTGQIARQVVREAMSKPSETAMNRNERASKIVASLRA